MKLDFEDMLQAMGSYEPPVMVVCLSALRDKNMRPLKAAFETVRAFNAFSKYKIYYVYDNPMTLPEDEVDWLMENVLKWYSEEWKVTDYATNTIKKSLICASNWAQVIKHPAMREQEIELAIVPTDKLANWLLNHTKTKPIIIRELPQANKQQDA